MTSLDSPDLPRPERDRLAAIIDGHARTEVTLYRAKIAEALEARAIFCDHSGLGPEVSGELRRAGQNIRLGLTP